MDYSEILKLHFCPVKPKDTKGWLRLCLAMCHESLTRENCFRAYGSKGFYEQELNNWRCYAAWPCPADTETSTLAGAAIATYSIQAVQTHDTLITYNMTDGRSVIQWCSYWSSTWAAMKLYGAWSWTLVVCLRFNRGLKNKIYVTQPAHRHVCCISSIFIDIIKCCQVV